MSAKKRRVVTWVLVALGVAFVGLGVALFVTLPNADAAGLPFPGFGAGRSGEAQAWGRGMWGGFPRMPWGMPGRMFGGCMLFFGIGVIFFIVFAVLRRPRFPMRRPRWGDDDAEEALRLAFAEGRITEEEYAKRLKILREGGTV